MLWWFSGFSINSHFGLVNWNVQVFSNNMGNKTEPHITKCKESDNWTKVSFKPDLAKFNMTHLEDDVVALMKKRVVDIAGCLGRSVKVELNGERVPIKSFTDYIDLYLKSANKDKEDPLPRLVSWKFLSYWSFCILECWFDWIICRFVERVNSRWEICVSRSEGQFQQVIYTTQWVAAFIQAPSWYIVNYLSVVIPGQFCKWDCNHQGWHSCWLCYQPVNKSHHSLYK